VGSVCGLGLLLLIAAVVMVVAISMPDHRRRSAPPEDFAEIRDEVRQAFRDQKPLADDEMLREMKVLFTQLGADFRDGDGATLKEHFDIDRMFDELVGQNVLPPELVRRRLDFIRGMHLGIGPTLQKQAPLIAWDHFEIRKIKVLPDNEAIVIVRHHTENGVVLKMRWWVVRHDTTWKIFDLDNLDMGMRFTTTMASAFEGGVANVVNLKRGIDGLDQALMALGREDFDTADRKLQEVDNEKLPRPLDGLRWMAKSCVLLNQGLFKEGLAALEKAEGLHPDMPIADLLRGVAHNGLEQWAEALKHLEKYHDLLGDDAVLCLQLGTALHGLERSSDGAAMYRKSLDLDPKNVEAFIGLLYSLSAQDKRDDVPARFAKLENRRETFNQCAEACRETQDSVGLEQLALAMKKLDPDAPDLNYYLFLAKAWTGDADDAIRLFKAALAEQKDQQKRDNYATSFLQAMVKSGKGVEAYAAAPAPLEAFRYLAAELKRGYRLDDLATLVAAHAKKKPDDLLLPFYQGEVFAEQENYLMAEKEFSAGMARPPDRVALEEFRSSRVLARYHTGKPLDAYKTIGPKDQTFEQLAFLLLEDKKFALLQKLIDLHGKTAPADDKLARLRIRLKIKQGLTADGVALFKTALAKQKQEAQRLALVNEFLLAMNDAGKNLEAYRAAPDPKQAFAYLVQFLTEEEDRPKLRKLLDAHRALHPKDHWLIFQTALLHQREGNLEKAAEEFVQWWQNAPEDKRKEQRYRCVLGLYKAGKIIKAYQEFAPRQDTFVQLAGLLIADKKSKELGELIASHRPHADDAPEFLILEARAQILAKAPDQAIPIFLKAYEKQKDPNFRKGYVNQFVQEMAEAGNGMAAYEKAPDRLVAFRNLAQTFTSGKKPDELEKLLEVHTKQHPNDPYCKFYRAEMHLLRGEMAEADREISAARALADRSNDWEFRNGFIRIRIKAGKTVAAYRELKPSRQTFATLAMQCIGEKNARELQGLIDAHSKADPGDETMPAWDLEVLWLKKDYDGTLKLLKEHEAGFFNRPRYRRKRDEYQVRSLVRLKNAKEAVVKADAIAKSKNGDTLLVLLAHAANGDLKRLLAVMDKAQAKKYVLQRAYADEDLGPILKGEPFKEFREKYPEPKEKLDADDED
jgi:hypothetical protein